MVRVERLIKGERKMKVIIQKCSQASVTIDNVIKSQIQKGFVLLVGFTHSDTMADVEYAARKIAKMRLFEDENGKINLDLESVKGDILSISQFTLYANTQKGNRPSFIDAARPELAAPLYDAFNAVLREYGFNVQTGIFGADMKVALINDGPVTIMIDTLNKTA